MTVTLTRSALETMLIEAACAHPLECCGLLLGTAQDRIDTALPARNLANDPTRHFEIDPQALIDAHRAERRGGPLLLGCYHSHPTGLAQPSATDQTQASGDNRLWAIIGGGEITLWRDAPDGFERLFYQVVGR